MPASVRSDGASVVATVPPMQVRPRAFGECLNAWFGSLGRNWKPLLALSVVSHVPVGILVVVVFLATGAHEAFIALSDPEVVEDLSRDELLVIVVQFAWGFGVWMFAQAVAGIFLYLAGARIVVAELVDQSAAWRVAGRQAMRGLRRALAAALIVLVGGAVVIGLAVWLAWVILVVLGVGFLPVFLVAVLALTIIVVVIWCLVSVAFGPQAIAAEDLGALGSLRRSFALVQQRWWVTLGFLVVTSIIASAAGQLLGVLTIPFFVIGLAVPTVIAVAYGMAAVIQGPVIAAIAAAYAIWYLDLRSRLEPVKI